MKEKLPDYLTAQAFLGNDLNPENLPECEVLAQIEDVENGLLMLQERIAEVYEL